MANWYGKARSNYVRIKPQCVELMKQLCAVYGILPVDKTFEGVMTFGFFPNCTENGAFCDCFNTEEPNKITDLGIPVDADGDYEMDWNLIAACMEDGEILVIETIGNEKLRYLTGVAEAYTNRGFLGSVSIDDIYLQFGIKNRAQY